MKRRRFLSSILVTLFAALAGNWAGEELRYRITGERGSRFRFTRSPGPEAEVDLSVNPALSNLLPALLVGSLRRPHAPWAFLSGALISAFIGDQYEDEFTGWLKEGVRRS